VVLIGYHFIISTISMKSASFSSHMTFFLGIKNFCANVSHCQFGNIEPSSWNFWKRISV